MTENKKSLSLSPGERNVPDETQRASRAYFDCLEREGIDTPVNLRAHGKAMRAALEAVLPDIERPLREQIKWLEDRVVPAIEKKWVERGEFIEGMTKLLAERDKEIERLGYALEGARADSSDNSTEHDYEMGRLERSLEEAEWKATGCRNRADHAEALLVERSFSKAEIEALLELIDRASGGRARDGSALGLWVSAARRLEKMRDES